MTDKTPLILLPGLLCDRALWAAQTDALSELADCRVADMTRDDTLAGMARRVLADAPETFALAGLSMGGYCALEIMRQAPERVSRLALLDTSAEADDDGHRAVRRAWVAEAEADGLDKVIPRHVEMYLHPDHLKDPALVATVTASARNVGLEAYKRQQAALAARPDSHDVLPAIACPTLVLCGRQDAATPLALHERMAAAIPGAELVVIEDCGHLAPLERPEEVSRAMRRWLSEREGTGQP